MKNKNFKIIYIVGAGHSGSTLLDIMMGSTPGFFSAGELKFITRPSIIKEYCSCGCLITNCEVWSNVWKLWDTKRKISFSRYKELQSRYERTKSTFRTLKNRLKPEADFLEFCEATQQFFESIHEATGAKVIIDSSKVPQRIAILERIADLHVIHLSRNFKGVLDSSKKSFKKDLKKGYEHDIKPKPFWKPLYQWPLRNFLSEIFCIGVKSTKVKYRNFVRHPEELKKIDIAFADITKRNPYKPEHLIAGNSLRTKDSVNLNPKVGLDYKRLNKFDSILGTIMDKLFYFWC